MNMAIELNMTKLQEECYSYLFIYHKEARSIKNVEKLPPEVVAEFGKRCLFVGGVRRRRQVCGDECCEEEDEDNVSSDAYEYF